MKKITIPRSFRARLKLKMFLSFLVCRFPSPFSFLASPLAICVATLRIYRASNRYNSHNRIDECACVSEEQRERKRGRGRVHERVVKEGKREKGWIFRLEFSSILGSKFHYSSLEGSKRKIAVCTVNG